MAEYKGTIELIGGLTPKNNGNFPLASAKDIQVDETGKRLDEKLADLEQGGGTVTVTVDGAVGTASHSSTEIYTLVQAGNTVVAVLPDHANYQYQYDGYNEPTAANAMRATAKFIHTAVDENGIVTTDYIIIHDDKSADAGYYEGTGGSSGADGITPHIGENGHWFIGDEDTGVKAQGEDGVGITSIDEMGGDAARTTYRINLSDGSYYEFDVYHGTNGTNGKSAYELWLAEGNTGSVDDFLSSLKGEDGGVLTLYISPDGNDSNDGLTASTPKKTVKACFVAGASRISAKRGIYREKVDISPTGGVGNVAGRTIEIFPTDNDQTYSTDTHDRERIIFDTSDEIALSAFVAYNSIKSAPYTVSNYTFTRIFANGATDGRASVWLVSADELTVCHKLTPVTTLTEVESTANTFYWSDGVLYVNADWTGVERVYVSNEMYNQMQFKGLASVILREVEARLSQGYCVNIENVPHFELYECVAKFTGGNSTGLHPKNASGKMVKCYATQCYDGLSPSGYGHTVYVDCVAEYNRDDGVSHHYGNTGTIIGGRYDHNGKGGIVPAYGAKVDIYGAVCRFNKGMGIGYLYTSTYLPASGIVQGAVLVGNEIGLVVNANCSVITSGVVYKDNTTNKSIHTSADFIEYDNAVVKTINGVEPDKNGNITIDPNSGEVELPNMIPLSINASGEDYVGDNGEDGYRVGYRVSSSGVEKAASNCCCTGFIPCVLGDTITIKNFTPETSGYGCIYFFTALGNAPARTIYTNNNSGNVMPDENGVLTVTATHTGYFRLTAATIDDTTIINVTSG